MNDIGYAPGEGSPPVHSFIGFCAALEADDRQQAEKYVEYIGVDALSIGGMQAAVMLIANAAGGAYPGVFLIEEIRADAAAGKARLHEGLTEAADSALEAIGDTLLAEPGEDGLTDVPTVNPVGLSLAVHLACRHVQVDRDQMLRAIGLEYQQIWQSEG